ncbi:MAG: rhomboid family intramembrane serine protease [Deltaproteobacteria bacterium]|nr:rhomboid family intramembrane serine protease [Deltaproteobacteria bacterium]MBW2016848.1 rhomboid family intramembrane serine protease [Deltaproteobacteria bacterium]MBW2130442.1 rhomboid family intramembrane serine protease [Deltaproteobacteria bacterium]MBW2304536.1 rhomboid family intramembrane serine protease [Deltaproteobacteria bacterium]
MIPIRDTTPSKNYPVVNTIIIASNVFFYLVQLAQGPALDRFILLYGLVPIRYSVPEVSVHFTFFQQIFSLFSFMFLHGGFFHLLGNMWTLYIFGDNVEDRLGPLRYLLFYLACGLTSGLFHLSMNWHSPVPTIGASGAIAGVMGAYLLLYPGAKILTLIPIFFIPYFVELPAFLFLGIWFLIQFLSATGSAGQAGGIAWWAHVGGFLAGMAFLKLFLSLPQTGITKRLRTSTERGRTPRLQVIRPAASVGGPDLYGNLVITPREAREGTYKLVNVQWGLRNRILRVMVPPGIRHGTLLRLSGLGRYSEKGDRGDLLLRVLVRD